MLLKKKNKMVNLIKNKYIIFSLSLLVGCAPIPMDKEVLNKNSISYTMESYQNYQQIFVENVNDVKHNIENNRIEESIPACIVVTAIYTAGIALPLCLFLSKDKDYTTMAEANSLDCLYLDNNSDDCIVYRRNHKKEDSKVNFFDYKRFLPKDSNIKTDDDFISLFELYNKNKEEKQACYSEAASNMLTSFEKVEKYKQCLTDEKIEENLTNYIHSGILKEKEQQKQEEKEQKRKREIIKKDCKQASEKVKLAVKKLTDYINQYNDLYNLHYAKVVDFSTDGLMVTLNGFDRYFIYTQDKEYATNDKFRDGGVFYKKDGFYKYTTTNFSTNSISILKPTKHKIIDFENTKDKLIEKTNYTIYLKDKNILDCDYFNRDDENE